MLQVISLFDPSALVLLASEWRALHDRAKNATPFQSWEWISAWWRWKGRGTPLILTARDQGTLVGLLPLVVDSYRGLPLRRVTFMGAPLSDYQDVLTEWGREAPCRDAFLAHLVAHRDRWDMLDFTDVPEQSVLAQAELPESDFWTLRAHHRVCPYMTLPTSLPPQARPLGEGLRCETAGEDDFPAVLEELLELRAFNDPDVRRFHHDAARQLHERGWLRLHRIADAHGATRAALYAMSMRGSAYAYIDGFDDTLVSYAIEQAVAEGAGDFHVLHGGERRRHAEQRRTLRIAMGQHTLRSSLAAEVSRVERSLANLSTRLRRRLSRAA
jgi:hypothetical protein